jgi:PST family polysaccharide transporter
MSALNRQILSATAWGAISAWGTRFTSIVVFFIVTRLLAPEAVGAVALLTAVVVVLQLLGELSIGDYVVRADEVLPEQLDSIFWVQLGLASVLAVVLCLASPLVLPSLHGDQGFGEIVPAMALLLPLFAATRVPEALLRRNLAFQKLATRNLIAAMSGGALGVALAALGFGVWALVLKMVCEAVLGLALVLRLGGWTPRLRWSKAALAAPLGFGLPLLGSRFITMLMAKLDTFVIGHFLGPATLGIYAVALRIYQIVQETFTSVADSVALPLLSSATQDRQRTKEMYLKLTKSATLLSMSAHAILVVCAPFALPVLLGPKWNSSIQPLQVLSLIGMTVGPLWFNAALHVAAGRTRAWMWAIAGSCLLTLILFVIGVQLYGVLGVVLAMVVKLLIWMPLSIHMARKISGHSPRELGEVLRPCAIVAGSTAIAGLAAAFASVWAGVSTLAALISVAMAAGVAFAAAAWINIAEARRLVSHVLSSRPRSGA